MKFPREHIDTLHPKDAQRLLIELGIDHLPRRGEERVLRFEGQGQYIMTLAPDKNYDILYEHITVRR
jgi:hypothetical protein